jgi:hypothetical protein
MLRIIFLILIVIFFAIPLLTKGKDFWDEKVKQAKVLGESAKKAVKYSR